MTDYVETRSGQASRYSEYAQRGRKGYEIEHIWADHPERHSDEFAHPECELARLLRRGLEAVDGAERLRKIALQARR